MGWLLARETMIAFALLGGLASALAMFLQRHGASRRVRSLNRIAYVFMGISIMLFVVSGFRTAPA